MFISPWNQDDVIFCNYILNNSEGTQTHCEIFPSRPILQHLYGSGAAMEVQMSLFLPTSNCSPDIPTLNTFASTDDDTTTYNEVGRCPNDPPVYTPGLYAAPAPHLNTRRPRPWRRAPEWCSPLPASTTPWRWTSRGCSRPAAPCRLPAACRRWLPPPYWGWRDRREPGWNKTDTKY